MATKKPTKKPEMAYVGRFNPVHTGHEAMIRSMIERSGRCVVFIGSASHARTIRHFFSYAERVSFLRKVFPESELSIVPLPDFDNDNSSWLMAIDSILSAIGFAPERTVFVGGCREEMSVLIEEGRKPFHIINRFAGKETPKVSATEVRDALLERRPGDLELLLNPAISSLVLETWEREFAKFTRE
ncbi:MAG: hypothetical protein KBC83_01700 [Candidatus Moranbacteria bacterium]|nr:hypothetical protein [Candidatus Moranbacteria bacterium]MBP9801363.1 hypothetical protein [Candidatus Moranbacteria bacterium]